MSKKQKLKEILSKLKSWAESSGDETLDNHLNELEDEINATADEEEDDQGGDTPPPPDIP